MESDTYLTLASGSEGLYKEKGSKFLAFAYPVNNEDQINEYLQDLRKTYYDARHHCYAYMLGNDQSTFRANDDGEPNHSAGDPILGQIRSNNLSDVLIVVIRYFGGTKLGVGGLINAYKTAASEAIQNNKIIPKVMTSIITVNFEYPAMNDIMKIVKKYNLNILEQDFKMSCKLIIVVRKKLVEKIIALFKTYAKVSVDH